MKKLLNLCLLLASLIGYLEWGGDNHAFLGQTEFQLLFQQEGFQNFMHPFVLLPLTGQFLLIVTLFQKPPSKILTYVALALLSMLLLFIFLIGIMNLNVAMILSAIPFMVTGILILRTYRTKKRMVL